MDWFIKKHFRLSVQALLFTMLVAFCTPYTCFDEANAYLADTENELVHYYLTPLPDNGEACIEAPAIIFALVKTIIETHDYPFHFTIPLSSFFHPPK